MSVIMIENWEHFGNIIQNWWYFIENLFSDGLHALVGFLGTPAAFFSVLFPGIVRAFPNLTELNIHKDFYSFLSQEIQDLIETHKDDLDVNNPNDLIDHFLIKIENNNEELTFLDVENQEEKRLLLQGEHSQMHIALVMWL